MGDVVERKVPADVMKDAVAVRDVVEEEEEVLVDEIGDVAVVAKIVGIAETVNFVENVVPHRMQDAAVVAVSVVVVVRLVAIVVPDMIVHIAVVVSEDEVADFVGIFAVDETEGAVAVVDEKITAPMAVGAEVLVLVAVFAVAAYGVAAEYEGDACVLA